MLPFARRPLPATVPRGDLLGIHLFKCPDTVGIVAKLSDLIASRGGNMRRVDVFVPDNKPVYYSRRSDVRCIAPIVFFWIHKHTTQGSISQPRLFLSANSHTTQNSGRATSSAPISSIWLTASMHKGLLCGYLILIPNTILRSSLPSRLFTRAFSLFLFYHLRDTRQLRSPRLASCRDIVCSSCCTDGKKAGFRSTLVAS